MKRANKRSLSRLAVLALIAATVLAFCVPELHRFANAQRTAPGFGSEVLVPVLPLFVLLMRRCWRDYARAAQHEGGENDDR